MMPQSKTQQTQPICSLSLDLDNQWSYMKIHGDAGWENFPSYLDLAVPRILSFLEQRQLKITFFIVGQDAALPKNHQALKAIAAAGHEIGNHSFHHDSWLHLYSEAEISEEIAQAEAHITAVTGHQPIGFRGPGYSFSPAVLNVLAQRSYQYDASTFPTFLGPIARLYYFMTSGLSRQERRQRKALFGKFRDGLQPLKPYHWTIDNPQLDGTQLLEIPVTTMPIFKIPIHFSYVLFLSSFSQKLALLYFWIAITLCRVTKTTPSLLLHPLDFMGHEDVSALSFFPGMQLGYAYKLETLSRALQILTQHFEVVPMAHHARAVQKPSRSTVLA